jgi:hypothetical protein
MHSKPVRTYLDPDAVGPLPRAVIADDSDALADARTIVRVPASPTQEISTDDVLEVVDAIHPRRRPSSLAPVGYDPGELHRLLPRRNLARYVLAAMAVAGLLLVVALVRSASSPPAPPRPAAASGPAPHSTVLPPAPIDAPATPAPPTTASPTPTTEATTGTLRIDGSAEGQKVYLDGVVLTASAALLRCGPHVLAVGSLARARIVDVPCGGDLTVFR